MKPNLRKPLFIAMAALLIIATDSRLASASGSSGGGGGGDCPSSYNACNNTDGCVSFFPASDSLYWVHWVGMSRNSSTTDPDRLHCKDRYRKVELNGQCLKGDFVEEVCEQGCSGATCNHI